jgi:hypothetical protein
MPKFVRQGDNTLIGNNTFTGTNTFSGSLVASGGITGAVTGAITGDVTGNLIGGNRRPVVEGDTGTYALATSGSGTVYVATKDSATQTYTLPAVATAGVYYTFICGHASGEILITPKSGEAIVITSFAAVGADADTGIVAPAAGTGIKNTAATNAIGDSITLVSSGTKWFSVGITSGIWASQ